MSLLDLGTIEASMRHEAERSHSPGNPAPLPELPAGRYTDPAFLGQEVAAMRRCWLFGIHGDEVPEIGSYALWEHLGQPLVFVRGEDREVRCFYNICRHRGGALLSDKCGQKRSISCPIHGWTYRLDGSLAGVRDRRDFAGVDLEQRSLIPVRCENLGELHFVNLDAQARPLIEDLGPIADEWQRYEPARSRLVRRLSLTVEANYKIVQEANLEVYHVNTVHPAIVSALLDSSAAPIELYPNGHSIQAARLRKQDFTESEIQLPRAEPAAAVSALCNVAFNMFPNRVIPMNAWGYPMLCFWPLDVRRTQVDVIWIAPRVDAPQPEAMWEEIVNTFNVVLMQDFVLCPSTQRSMDSGACRGLQLGFQERAIYHFHEEMDRCIGADRVPASLRVRPVLEGQVFRG
jgi:phenylpropionate dioxygenase-like ring-hydroxylating dioxygenase large terminal subunit